MAKLKEVYKNLPCPGVIIKSKKSTSHPCIECWYNTIKEHGDKIMMYNSQGGLVVNIKNDVEVNHKFIEVLGREIYNIELGEGTYYMYPEKYF